LFSLLNIRRTAPVVNDTAVRSERALLWGVPAVALLTGLVWILGQGASWYEWKLPEPTAWTRLSAWTGYAAHQIVSWGLIYYAQTRARRWTRGLKTVNVVAIGANLGFIAPHEIQTQVFHDGLAQDVSIFSSQGSVVLLLVVVLLMENRRRGLVAGGPRPSPPSWSTSQGDITIICSVGLLFTLLVPPDGHHEQAPDRLLFGFLAVFVITQMHGLGLSARTRWLLLAAWLAGAGLVYGNRGLVHLHELLRVPMAEYLVLSVLVLLLWPFALLARRLTEGRRRDGSAPAAAGGNARHDAI
jgi:hypothetical protein